MAKEQDHLTTAERERRVMDVYPLVVDGFRFAQIKEIVAKKCGWRAPERTLERYIAEARAMVDELARLRARGEVRRGGRLPGAPAPAGLDERRPRDGTARAVRAQPPLRPCWPPRGTSYPARLAIKGYLNMDMEEL